MAKFDLGDFAKTMQAVPDSGTTGSERIEYIFQSCDRRGGEFVFKLRNITFGQFASVGEFLLREVVLKPQSFDFCANFHKFPQKRKRYTKRAFRLG